MYHRMDEKMPSDLKPGSGVRSNLTVDNNVNFVIPAFSITRSLTKPIHMKSTLTYI